MIKELTKEEILRIAPTRLKTIEGLEVGISTRKGLPKTRFVYYQIDNPSSYEEEREVRDIATKNGIIPRIETPYRNRLLLGADVTFVGQRTTHLGSLARNSNPQFKGIGAELITGIEVLVHSKGFNFMTLISRNESRREYERLNEYYESLGFRRIMSLPEKDYNQVLNDYIEDSKDRLGGAFNLTRNWGLVKDLRD